MQGEIQRKIEGRYPGDRSDGKAADDAEASLRRRQQIERNDVALNALCFLRGYLDRENAPVGFDLGIANRLGGFQANRASDFVAMPTHFCREFGEDRHSLKRWHSLERRKNGFRRDSRRFELFTSCEIGRANELILKWIADFKPMRRI